MYLNTYWPMYLTNNLSSTAFYKFLFSDFSKFSLILESFAFSIVYVQGILPFWNCLRNYWKLHMLSQKIVHI